MKSFTFYRVDYRQQMESKGFSFHTSRRAARMAVTDGVRKGTVDQVEDGGSDIEEIKVVPTKKGILAALERFGKHPDNG